MQAFSSLIMLQKNGSLIANMSGQVFLLSNTLARYLYRGVISEKNIVANRDGKVTFKYIDNNKITRYRILDGEDFIKLILQHVLPKGFRRVRDYGFLHNNAKKIRHLIQIILRVVVNKVQVRPRPLFKCKPLQVSDVYC